MISVGMDINAEDRGGFTGLMLAMSYGSIEVVRILLGCKNIKIDTKDSLGRTALQWACLQNQVECIQLLLTHNTCTKNIVRMESITGETAEMMANRKGNHECARLV